MGSTDLLFSQRSVAPAKVRLAIGGASNSRGKDQATGNPLLLGYPQKPAATKFVEDGNVMAGWATDHFGAEVGLTDRLVNHYQMDPARLEIIKYGVPGSSLASWKSVHLEELIAVFAIHGWPLGILWIQGSNDSTSPALSAAYGGNIRDVANVLRRDRGASMGITIVPVQSDLPPADYPHQPVVRTAQYSFVSICQASVIMVAEDLPVASDGGVPPDFHYTGPSQYEIGSRWADLQVQQGVIVP